MSIDSVSTGSAKTGKTNGFLRRVVSTGVYSELVAVTIPPGEETREETHDNSDQVMFIVEGRGEAILNGQAEPTGEHDAVFIPAGTAHNIKNSGAADLKMFVTYSPPLEADAWAPARGQGTKNFYALIVMNVRPAHRRWAGHLPGIAYRVVTEAPCPVVTIR